ncbi:hypothetical protein AX16_001138 [Volvariella volvacea WC 439]|nr:hypothetical protein AX16_001138 [Volvariella volvacea WC 439]
MSHTHSDSSSADLGANVPLDLIFPIAESLDSKSLLQLRLVSRTFSTLVSPLALRNVTIVMNNRSVKDRIAICSQQLPGVYQHARSLTTRTGDFNLLRYIDRNGLPDLYNTIGQLKNLTSFKISWQDATSHRYHPQSEVMKLVQEIQEGLAGAVWRATGGMLRELTIEPWITRPVGLPDALLQFRELRTLRFDCLPPQWKPNLAAHIHTVVSDLFQDNLGVLVRGNPHLESLQISKGWRFFNATPLFHYPGEGDGPSALCTLTIEGVEFSHTLDLRQSPFLNLQHLHVLSSYSSLPMDHLWLALQASGIRLRTLVTQQVSHPLVKYIASYSGLEQLAMQDIEDLHVCTSPECTELFFKTALPRHSSTLTKLSIVSTNYPGAWAFNPPLWMPALESLQSLESLQLYPRIRSSFNPPQSHEDYISHKDHYEEMFTEPYQEALDHIGGLIRLEILEITWMTRAWYAESFGLAELDVRELFGTVSNKLGSRNGVPKKLVWKYHAYEQED